MTQPKLNALTVGQLRTLLEHFEDDLPVVVAYGSADHWRTQLALPISEGDVGEIKFSAYHAQFQIAETSTDCEQMVLVLK
jgi:hypothetical protein